MMIEISQNIIKISPDDLLMEDGKYIWTPQRARNAWSQSYKELDEAMSSGRYNVLKIMCGAPGSGKSTYIQNFENLDDENVIFFDATFKNRKSRKDIIRRAKNKNFKIECIFMNTDLKTCKQRNSLRSSDRLIPNNVIEDMHNCLKHSPPSLDEGFDSVFIYGENSNG